MATTGVKRARTEEDDAETRTTPTKRRLVQADGTPVKTSDLQHEENPRLKAPKLDKAQEAPQNPADSQAIDKNNQSKTPQSNNSDAQLPPKRPANEEEEAEVSRPRKRPGAAARISREDKEAVEARQKQRAEEALKAATVRGVQDAVRQHYNAVPQRGRDWRSTESRIKGLRKFNNWVKSTLIHRFSPPNSSQEPPIRVLDLGCGKGGDLGKWQSAPHPVDLYVGIDPAEVSIDQARDRYADMSRGGGRGGRGGRGGHRGGRPQRAFDAEFIAQDAFGQSLGSIPIVQNVGFAGDGGSRWAGGGFDVVTMMFCMHYAFENEAKTRGMLANVAGSLKKGGRFFGVIPNSDVIRSHVEAFHQSKVKAAAKEQKPSSDLADGRREGIRSSSKQDADSAEIGDSSAASHAENDEEGDLTKKEDIAEWGNSIYRVRFPGKTPEDGVFRPPYGWKYNYFMEEAVEEVPEYVVPWEAFRA